MLMSQIMKPKSVLLLVFLVVLLVVAAFNVRAATYRPPASSISDGSITSAKIADTTIVNADVSGSAAIASSKLSFTGNALTFPAGVGASSTALQNNGSGGLSWNPTSYMTVTHGTSSGVYKQTAAINVVAGDTLYIRGSAGAGGSCNGAIEANAFVSYKPSNMGTTSSATYGNGGQSVAGQSCSGTAEIVYVATTTLTVFASVSPGGGATDKAFLTVLKIHQ